MTMLFQWNRIGLAVIFTLSIYSSSRCLAATGRFEKVTDHCYSYQMKSGESVAAIATDEGIVLVDPPSEPELSQVVESLKRLSPKPVRWVVFTNPRSVQSGGAAFFADQGAMLIGGSQLRSVSASMLPTGGKDVSASLPWLVFERQLHLFPSNIEIRIMAVDQKGTTGGDVILHVPAERVVFIGKFYEAARYPEIDAEAQGNAAAWADAAKRIIDSVPALKIAIPPKPAVPPKPAMPPKPPLLPNSAGAQAKTESKEPESTIEETIAVIASAGEVSNLQNLKDMLSACQKLRADLSKSVKSGRSCDNFLSSSRADMYRVYGNFNSYAARLCEGIALSPDK
jgi:hypothetical protein